MRNSINSSLPKEPTNKIKVKLLSRQQSGKFRRIVKVAGREHTLSESQILPLAKTSASQALKQLLEENNALIT